MRLIPCWFRNFAATIAIVGVLVAGVPKPAHADLPVIDIAHIIQTIKGYVLDLKRYLQQELSFLTQLSQLEQEISSAASLVMMVVNFIHNPSLATAMGLLDMAGIDMDLPVDPFVVQSLLTGYNGITFSGLLGKAEMLGSLIPASHSNDTLYTCTDDSFACVQSKTNANALAAHKGTLEKLYEGLVNHNPVLQGLRTDMKTASDPKTVLDATGQAQLEGVWTTSQAAQIAAVNGMAHAQELVEKQQADEKYRKDAEAFLSAVPK